MLEQGLIKPTQVIDMKTLYFSHFKTKEEINEINIQEVKPPYFKEFLSSLDELSRNDWELHKKLIEEGHNPNEIAKIIRNDEIEKLQEISSQTNFDFNQTIEPSLYERCSFINKENVTLIDYAAYFSAVKCFKFLLMNGANVNSTGKYAIAGGNEEIIHLCEQNHSSFKNAYRTAIEFHKSDIFKYIYERKLERKNVDLLGLGKICLTFNNYEVLSFLEKKGMKINENFIEEIASNGNTFLMEIIMEKQQIPKTILPRSVISGNIEIVKFLLESGADINAQNIIIISNLF